MHIYKILLKPHGIIDRILASNPKEAIKIFIEKNPEWETFEGLKAKRVN
jgi:hypothetical protein